MDGKYDAGPFTLSSLAIRGSSLLNGFSGAS
jgi:hypothetical protein